MQCSALRACADIITATPIVSKSAERWIAYSRSLSFGQTLCCAFQQSLLFKVGTDLLVQMGKDCLWRCRYINMTSMSGKRLFDCPIQQFGQANFPARISDERELIRYCDIMNELDSEQLFFREKLYSRTEAALTTSVSAEIETIRQTIFRADATLYVLVCADHHVAGCCGAVKRSTERDRDGN